MKTEELRKKDIQELNTLVIDLRKELSDLRFKKAANQLKSANKMGVIKRDIARMLTIIKENINTAQKK